MEGSSPYAGRLALISGAAGYIGQRLISQLLGAGGMVRAVVRSGQALRGAVAGAGGRLELIEGDVTEPQVWRRSIPGADVVFHLASQTSHYVADDDPLSDWRSNVSPIYFLYDACRSEGVRPRVVFPSTASVYGLPDKLPVNESAPLVPVTVYDVHKLAAEHYLVYQARSVGVPGVALRLSNVYGPSAGSSQSDRGFLNRIAARALRGEEIQVYGSGEYLRDYLHISDVVSALMQAGAAPEERVTGRAFNVCTGTGTNLIDALRAVVAAAGRLTGRHAAIRHVEPVRDSPIDRRQFIGDSRAFIEATGWTPAVPLGQGIEDLIVDLAKRVA